MTWRTPLGSARLPPPPMPPVQFWTLAIIASAMIAALITFARTI